MNMSKKLTALSWICRLAVAIILFQTLFFKFTGAEESRYIFSTVLSPELEAFGRIGSALVELVGLVMNDQLCLVEEGGLLIFLTPAYSRELELAA